MEDKIEKIMNSPGYKNAYQYFVGGLIFISWIFANMITASLAYLENTSKVKYIDHDTNEVIETSLTYEICEDYKGEYNVTETYGYSWVIDADIECDRAKVSLIGTVCYTGNMLGALSYTFLSKILGLKKTLISGLILMGSLVIIAAFMKNFWFNIFLCILGNIGCNTICYSSIQLSSEFVHADLRSIFNAFTNIGYTLSGILFILLFWFLDSWSISFFISGIAMIAEAVVCIFFLTHSPREALYRDIDEFLDILDTIAKFNRRTKEHEHNMTLPEYKEIIHALKKEYGNKKHNNVYEFISSPQILESPVIAINNDVSGPEPIEINDNKDKIIKLFIDSISKTHENGNSNNIAKSIELKDNEYPKMIVNTSSRGEMMSPESTIKKYRKLSDQTNDEIRKESSLSNNALINKDNKRKNSDMIQPIKEEKKKNEKIPWYAIFKYESIRKKMIMSTLAWFLDRIVYEGIAIGIKNLPGNIYVNGIIFYVLETGSYFISGFMMEKKIFGRKRTALIGLVVSAVLFLFVAIFINYETPSLILSLICRFTITMAYGVFSVYCLEIYPTPVRAIGYGITSIFNNIGGIIIPLVVEQVSTRVINIIFTVLSGSDSILMLFLEETIGRPMPETIKEIEEEKKKKNIENEKDVKIDESGNIDKKDKDNPPRKIIECDENNDNNKNAIEINVKSINNSDNNKRVE